MPQRKSAVRYGAVASSLLLFTGYLIYRSGFGQDTGSTAPAPTHTATTQKLDYREREPAPAVVTGTPSEIYVMASSKSGPVVPGTTQRSYRLNSAIGPDFAIAADINPSTSRPQFPTTQ